MTAQVLPKRGRVALGSIAAASMLYQLLLRRPILNWGATDAEAHARLSNDELLVEADGVATPAITIGAPPSAVWPWVAQIGPSPRGGAYTYDRIENLLGLDMHSADRVLPEYQHPQVGETLGMARTACGLNASNRSACLRADPKTATGSGPSSSTNRTEEPG
jgi:hypothetical protein